MSTFNSKTTFLYQLFKENSNFIVTKQYELICKSIFKSRSAYRVTFLPIMCAFGKNLDFVTEWLDFPENRCNRKSIVDLHKRIFFQADFGWFFVIKSRSAVRLTFFPITRAFGENSDFLIEALEFAQNRCK